MKVIVTGHGHFATGLESTVKLLAGGLPNVEFIDFADGMNDHQLQAKYIEALTDAKQAVFFCDLLGGTPFKEAVKLTASHPEIDIAVTTGCNIGSLMELGLQLTSYSGTAHELAQQFVTTSQAQTKVFEHHQVNNEPADDGI